MPQQKTGTQRFLLVLSILKFIGAAFFVGLGGLIIAMGGMPEIQENIEPVVSQLEDPSINATTLMAICGGILIVYGVLGIIHGLLDLKASKPMGGTTGAIVMGILALVWNALSVVGSFSNMGSENAFGSFAMIIVMLVLNLIRVILAFKIKGDNDNMAAMGGDMGMPMGSGMPPQGGYDQPQQFPQQGGYGQPQQFPQQGGYDPNYGQGGNYGNGGF